MQFTPRVGLKTTLLATTLALISILVVAATTTPDRLGPFGITLWFIGMLVALGGVLTIILYQMRKRLARQDKAIVFSIALRHGVLISTWMTALVALNSLRQLRWLDIVLVSVLIILIEFYLRRTTPA